MENSVEIVFITGGSAVNPRPREHFNVFCFRLVGLFVIIFFFSLHNVWDFFLFVRSIKSLFCTDLPLTDPYTANKKGKVSYNFILSGRFSNRQAKFEGVKIPNYRPTTIVLQKIGKRINHENKSSKGGIKKQFIHTKCINFIIDQKSGSLEISTPLM